MKKRADDLVAKRKTRRRQEGDGGGVDVSISSGYFGTRLEKKFDEMSPETRSRLLKFIRGHVEAAIGPLVRLFERDGQAEDARYIHDVGPNMLRTIIEDLEGRDDG